MLICSCTPWTFTKEAEELLGEQFGLTQDHKLFAFSPARVEKPLCVNVERVHQRPKRTKFGHGANKNPE